MEITIALRPLVQRNALHARHEPYLLVTTNGAAQERDGVLSPLLASHFLPLVPTVICHLVLLSRRVSQ